MVTIVMMMLTKAMLTMPPRTNPTAKQLHCVMVRGTAVDVTGCIILLQFCPKLTKVDLHLLILTSPWSGWGAVGAREHRRRNLHAEQETQS